MTKQFAWLAGFLLLALQPLTALAASPAQAPTLQFTLKAPGEPTLHITEASNGVVFREFKGQIVLLNFFGKHCRWCMKEIPHLVDLQKKYKGKLQIVAIHAQQPITGGERALLQKRFHFNYPIYEYMDNPDFVQYISHRAAWDGGLPFSIIFDQKGSAVKIIGGYAPEEHIAKIIDYLLSR
ncbi:TlpA disulfide reductase family protein [Hydrogenimonas sp. SS33]|uniref:TlpA family protein disulfide reductase n=1 Tax=Hydrogenimonas leucolamina TaxID=2954236 RepID=UPI00336BD6A6